MDNSLINSGLSSAFLGFVYVGYKIFKRHCKSKCTDSGLQVEINILESRISQKLDDHKDAMLTALIDKLTDKIQANRSPRFSAATAPTLQTAESRESIDI